MARALDGLHLELRAVATGLVADVQAGLRGRVSEQLAQAMELRDRLINFLEAMLETSA